MAVAEMATVVVARAAGWWRRRTERTVETARRVRGGCAAQITQRRTQGASQIGRIAPRFMAYGGPGQSARLTVCGGEDPQHRSKMARRRDMRSEEEATCIHAARTHEGESLKLPQGPCPSNSSCAHELRPCMKAVRLVTSLWCHLSSPLITSVRWNMGARLTHCSDGRKRARDVPGEDVATRAGVTYTRNGRPTNGHIGAIITQWRMHMVCVCQINQADTLRMWRSG